MKTEQVEFILFALKKLLKIRPVETSVERKYAAINI